MDLIKIHEYIHEYIKFVFKYDRDDDCNLWCEKPITELDEYLNDSFKFSATNNWESGFDFVDWLNGKGDMGNFYEAIKKPKIYRSIVNNSEIMYEIIKKLITYYENNNKSISFDNISSEKIICMYVYVYIDEMDLKILKNILYQ